MAKPRILVTGSNGQLGKSLEELISSYPAFDFIFLSRADMPIHHFDLLRNTFKAHHPQYCINCAAYTNVDRAEQEKELAFQVNGEAVGVLAAVCSEYNTKFVHISTDYVFDGSATVPYSENSQTNPINTYGASKLEGEKQVFQFNPDSIIIRSSWIYSEYGKNFVKTMLNLMSGKNEISVVNDQLGSPTYAVDLAETILRMIENWKSGIYHYCNEGVISWFVFAEAIREITGSNTIINPIPTSQYPTPARRPKYSALETQKIQTSFRIVPKNWRESLGICIKKIQRQG